MTRYSWHHVHVVHDNWHEAAEWHAQHSNVRREDWEHPAHKRYRSEVMRSVDNLVLIQQTQHSEIPKEGGIDSLGISVEDLSESVREWTLHGGHVLEVLNDCALVLDPWGLRCELVESDSDDGSSYQHVNVATERPVELAEWYLRHLGGEFVKFQPDTERVCISYDSMNVVFMRPRASYPLSATSVRHIDHLGWFASDFHVACDELQSAGVVFPASALRGNPNPPPRHGPRTPAFAEDPCGNWFELVGVPEDRLDYVKHKQWEID